MTFQEIKDASTKEIETYIGAKTDPKLTAMYLGGIVSTLCRTLPERNLSEIEEWREEMYQKITNQ